MIRRSVRAAVLAVALGSTACRSPAQAVPGDASDATTSASSTASASASASSSPMDQEIALTTQADTRILAPSGEVAAAADGDPKTTWEGAWIAVALPADATAETLVITGAPEETFVRITHDGFDLYPSTMLRHGTVLLPRIPKGGVLRVEASPRTTPSPTLVLGEISVRGKIDGAASTARSPRAEVSARPPRFADVGAFCGSFGSSSCAPATGTPPAKQLVLVDVRRLVEAGTWRAVLWTTKQGLLDTGVRVLDAPQRRPTGNSTETLRYRWLERVEARDTELRMVIRALYTNGFTESGPGSVLFAPKTSYVESVVTCRPDRCETRYVATSKHEGLPERAEGGVGIVAPPSSAWTVLR